MNQGVLESLLPDRAIRSYPALLSTEYAAQSWAREGAPSGAVVVAGYQASPRGRGGIPWQIPEAGAGFSVLTRRRLLEHQEGWYYLAATTGLADRYPGSTIVWPDLVQRDGHTLGRVAVHSEVALLQILWAVVSFAVEDAGEHPEETVASVITAFEDKLDLDPTSLVEGYERRLRSRGRRVTAHMIPMGPNGRRISGTALGVDEDGALMIEGKDRTEVGVRPQDVGRLEEST